MDTFLSRKGSNVKESLSEYGSGWGWEYNTYAHAFDQTRIGKESLEDGVIVKDDTPIRYSSNGTVQGYCTDEWEITNGRILFSESVMHFQKSCKPNTGNAGNWYSWPAATAGGSKSSGNEINSICPTGWQLTVNVATNPKSYYYLIRTAYNVTESNDERIRLLPMSFVRPGRYDQGSLGLRTNYGYYWSSAAYNSNEAYFLYFSSDSLNPQKHSYYGNKGNGHSVRCVSR